METVGAVCAVCMPLVALATKAILLLGVLAVSAIVCPNLARLSSGISLEGATTTTLVLES